MAELEVRQSTQFVIKDLKIVSKVGEIDISGIFEEINIFDSIFNPCITGNILIKDSIGLSHILSFDGSEILKLDIGKDEDSVKMKRAFRIYKQSDRKNLNQTSEVYVLHFVSDEFIFSEQQKVNQSYTKTYSDVAINLLTEYLNVPINLLYGDFQNSIGIKDIVVPNLKPIEALEWCAKRAVDKSSSPSFIFFENRLGYNFTTLSSLMSKDIIANINYSPKNLKTENGIANEILGARDIKIISQYDFINNIQNGVFAGKFVGFDPITRKISEKAITFSEHYKTMNHGNKTPNLAVVENRAGAKNTEMFNSKKSLYSFGFFRKDSKYIQQNDPTSLQKDTDSFRYIFQRQAIFNNLLNQRIQVVLPGNFFISSGFMVNVMIPNHSAKTKEDDNMDKTLYGKYLIIATRHIIKYDRHEVVFEAATDSSNEDAIYKNSQQQKQAIYY